MSYIVEVPITYPSPNVMLPQLWSWAKLASQCSERTSPIPYALYHSFLVESEDLRNKNTLQEVLRLPGDSETISLTF